VAGKQYFPQSLHIPPPPAESLLSDTKREVSEN